MKGLAVALCAVLIGPRVGWFVAGGLEIEPELLLMLGEGVGLSYVLNGNIAYNFNGYSYTRDTDITIHIVQFGIGVLL